MTVVAPAQLSLPGAWPTPQGGADVDDAIRPPTGGESPRVSDLLAALQAEVAALRAELHREIRTRRVVVVEEDGFERIVLSADGSHGEVVVAARPSQDRLTRTELFALDSDDTEGPFVGIELVDRGNSVAGLSVLEGHRPRLWDDTP
jgi:hypothetical protein